MDLTREIKDRVQKANIQLVGITPVERLQNAPVGRRPKDILPTAQNVIVAAVHVLDSVYDLPYTRYEYTNQFFILNSRLNSMATRICEYLESEGYRNIPIPAAYPRINKDLCGVLSHRHAAVQAGIGEFALNNMLTTSQFGARVRLVSIVTEAELEADEPYKESLCKQMQGECGKACVQNCPAHAISDEGLINKDSCLRYQEQIMPWSAAELRCGTCIASCPIAEPKWKIPAGSRPAEVKAMKELWAGAKWTEADYDWPRPYDSRVVNSYQYYIDQSETSK
jgi:epoxyqueuosine reductase QueG